MKSSRSSPYVLLAPFAILFCLFFIIPLAYSVYLSLYVNPGFGPRRFVGLTNYVTAIHDQQFWQAVGRVAYYGIVQVSIMLAAALLIALLLDSPFVKGKTVFRLIYFLPYAVPGVIAALMWGFLYSSQLDPLLNVLRIFNGGNQVDVLASNHILYSIMNMATWEWVGYNMTIYIANLTSIPYELYDAAKIDGCNEVQIALHVKLPLLAPTISLTTVLSIVGSLQLFNEPYILGSLTSIPSSFTPNMDIYNMAFSFGNFNYSAALSIMLALITVVATALFMLVTRRRDWSVRKRAHPNALNSSQDVVEAS